MYKLKILLLICVFCSNANATEVDESYLSISFQGNQMQTVHNKKYEHNGLKSFGGAIEFGLKMTDHFNIGLVANYIYNGGNESPVKVAERTINVISAMNLFSPEISLSLNGDINKILTLYAGVSGGLAILSNQMKVDIDTGKFIKSDKTKFTGCGHLNLGMLCNLKNTSVELGYSLGYYAKPYDFNMIFHIVKLGLRYNL
jgi:hypothetical protein